LLVRGPLFLTTLLVPAWVIVSQGCSGESSFDLPVAREEPSTRYASACSAWARSFCQYQMLCNFPYSAWNDQAQCVARQTLACELIAADPNVRFDANRVAQCSFPKDCFGALPQCWETGRAPAGSPCLWDQACQSGGCIGAYGTNYSNLVGSCGVCGSHPGQPCTSASDCFSNSCGAYAKGQPDEQVCGPFGSPGDLCGGGLPICASGLCSDRGSASVFRCVAPAPHALPGQPCDGQVACVSGACSTDDGGAGTCAPLRTLGEACGTLGPYCGPGLECRSLEADAGPRHCVAVPREGYGAGCSIDDDTCTGFGACGGPCTPPAEDGGWCCVAPAADGESCDDAMGVGCLPPSSCIAGHCIFLTVGDCSP
jgi:hypothetical protein